MGCTLEQLSQSMSAAEFAEHFMLERLEPLPPGEQVAVAAELAAAANGPLQLPAGGKLWRASDFYADPWSDALPSAAPPARRPHPKTVDEIMATARAAGMA